MLAQEYAVAPAAESVIKLLEDLVPTVPTTISSSGSMQPSVSVRISVALEGPYPSAMKKITLGGVVSLMDEVAVVLIIVEWVVEDAVVGTTVDEVVVIREVMSVVTVVTRSSLE